MNDNDINKNDAIYMFKMIKYFFNKYIKKVKYNYYITGTVMKVNSDSTYDVLVNGDTWTLKARAGVTPTVNKVVYITVVNNDFSTKFIDCMVP